jgi:hypothetical protein
MKVDFSGADAIAPEANILQWPTEAGRKRMELTADQDATFRGLCREIKPGEYGRVIVSFVGTPSNLVQITGEKNFRFQHMKAETAIDKRRGYALKCPQARGRSEA